MFNKVVFLVAHVEVHVFVKPTIGVFIYHSSVALDKLPRSEQHVFLKRKVCLYMNNVCNSEDTCENRTAEIS